MRVNVVCLSDLGAEGRSIRKSPLLLIRLFHLSFWLSILFYRTGVRKVNWTR